MWKSIALVFVISIAIVLGIAAIQPGSFRVERSVVVDAPPAKAYALIDDFRQWPRWSPWENIDPALKREYSGAASGVGSVYAWQGNDQVGSGRMEILESAPDSRVRIRLDFLAPFEAHNTAEFGMAAEGAGTRVTWAMYGPSPYPARLMGLFFSMDDMVGKDFERGLAQLKAAAEGDARAR